MDMTIRPMTPAEHNYGYTESQQLMSQTGCIGHLRGDMGSSGTEFFSTWNDYRPDLKTEAFKAEFDAFINALRFDESYGGVLTNCSKLSAYCCAHPESRMDSDGHSFGFRADTERYSYMLRLNPYKGEYNLYCYCYVREWLERHLKDAEKGIRFITPSYETLFHIPDGGKIRITAPDGETTDCVCRYIDEIHLQVGLNSLYHICEFAELMKRNGNTVAPI